MTVQHGGVDGADVSLKQYVVANGEVHQGRPHLRFWVRMVAFSHNFVHVFHLVAKRHFILDADEVLLSLMELGQLPSLRRQRRWDTRASFIELEPSRGKLGFSYVCSRWQQ